MRAFAPKQGGEKDACPCCGYPGNWPQQRIVHLAESEAETADRQKNAGDSGVAGDIGAYQLQEHTGPQPSKQNPDGTRHIVVLADETGRRAAELPCAIDPTSGSSN